MPDLRSYALIPRVRNLGSNIILSGAGDLGDDGYRYDWGRASSKLHRLYFSDGYITTVYGEVPIVLHPYVRS